MHREESESNENPIESDTKAEDTAKPKVDEAVEKAKTER